MKAIARGFTLIELLIVVALISIMLAIAVPSFATFISNYRATSAVNDLLQAITLTRTEALKRGRKVTLAPISGDWTNGWTVFIDTGTATPPVWSSTEELIYRHDALPSSTTITAPDGGTSPFGNNNYVAFDGTGYPRTTSGATLSGGIVLTDRIGTASSQVRTLCLALYGRPRIVTASAAASCSTG